MSLNGVDTEENEQATPFYKSKKVIIVLLMLIMLLIVSVYVGAFQLLQKLPEANLATFTCRHFLGNETFTITVEVNASDGIDQDEAIEIATRVFNEAFNIQHDNELKSISVVPTCDEHGIWTVDFDIIVTFVRAPSIYWGIRRIHFKVAIDPLDHTVLYGSS